MDSLLAEYDREVLPTQFNHSAVTVQVNLDLKHAYIDQKDSTMRLLADLKMKWRDKRIMWNETEWGCDYAVTSAERIWLPDIVLLNAAATGVSSSPVDVALRARLNFDGEINWVARLDLTAPVTLELYDWPNDKQRCTFKFGSRSYNLNELELAIEKDSAVIFESGEWNVNSVKDNTSIWNRDDDQLSVVMWTVNVSRRAPAHSLAATAVVFAAALLLTAAIALPPDQRHALAACASFTAALWLITCLVRLPGAHTCPRVVRIMCAICVCGAACGVCAGFVRRLARCTAAPPHRLRTLLHALSTICSLTPSSETGTDSENGAWAAAAVLADRVLCAGLLFTVLVLLLVHIS